MINVKLMIFALAALLALPVGAEGITDAEMAMLPPLCAAKIKRINEDYWRSQFAHDDWIHLHHYCGGLNAVNRLYRLGAVKAAIEINGGLWEFNYVLGGTSKDCKLRPEMHYNKGILLQFKKDYGAALLELQKAIDLRPNYVEAILSAVHISDQYLNRKDMAIEFLKKGIIASPNIKSLQKKYIEMGGDIEFINKLSSKDNTGGKIIDSVDVVENKDPKINAPQVDIQLQQVPMDGKVQSYKGVPSDPWCRFCPEIDTK